MSEPKHTIDDLRQMQALPLNLKIRLTEDRIRGWLDQYDAYVSFSGGKDSTVLLDICRKIDPNIPAVFVDTGLEYPEIRNFVKTFDNVIWLKPKMNFKKVIETYGYPFISKEVSFALDGSKRFLENRDAYKDKKPLRIQKDGDAYKPYALLRLEGKIGEGGNKGYSMFNLSKWEFMLDAPFYFSHKCCNVMKKKPFAEYHKKTGKYPITAQMACESRLRKKTWLQHGCNMWNAKKPMSNPMSFWTEQDVLQYVKENNLPICSVYGDVVLENESGEETAGQMSIMDIGENQIKKTTYKTTGLDRTGCMFCGFGCHIGDDHRFELMKETHPKQYEWIMKPWDDGGLGYKEVIDWINEHGDLNIKY